MNHTVMKRNAQLRSTTILTVRRDGRVAIGGDGQVSIGNTVMKADAVKIRPLADGKVLAGFAGGAADAFALLERFEAKLKDYPANMPRAATELGILYNTGEGGLHQDFYKYGKNTIVQVASGRFGVHKEYLDAGVAVEIKMGQGAKPGIGESVQKVFSCGSSRLSSSATRLIRKLPSETPFSPGWQLLIE